MSLLSSSPIETLIPAQFSYMPEILPDVTAQKSEQSFHIDVAAADIDMKEAEREQGTEEARPVLVAITSKLISHAGILVLDVIFLYRLLRHPGTPWYARGVLFLPVMYLCSPIQLIPNFIPVLGQVDDVFMVWVGKRCAEKLVHAETRRECYDAAAAIRRSLFRRLNIS
ncbi:YkvA family protein [Terriglobus sp. TAA 43]|uniref:YkvA family protein n=1 Tax=Terriglobus sp. TAA 43 TaxID=278961 RepID=UPI0018DE12A9|nr:DUF1232 domain-containing protein [Terriglobus sp. TAA 43]